MLNRGLFDKIIADCIHYVMKVEVFERIHKVGLDDFMQMGRESVFKGLKTFDSTKGATFNTFAFMKIKSDLIKVVRSLQLQKRDTSKNISIDYQMEDDKTIENYLPTKTNVEQYVVNKVTVEQLMTRVNKHQRNVLMYRLQGYTFSEISQLLGRGNDRTMHQAFKLAIAKMRKGA